MEEKKKNDPWNTILTIFVIALAILLYPWFVEVRDGESICSNLIGYEYKFG